MTRVNRAALAIILTAGLCAPLALAQGEKATPPAAKPAQPGTMKMPSPEEMKKMQDMMEAYTKASQPGKEHEFLKKTVGAWTGKVKSYEAPGQPPQESECTEHVTSILGGRFTKCEVSGEMGQMGHFEGLGIYGYDNAKQKFTMSWADNMGTCIMDGTGELSTDKKALTWTMNYVDPATHKASTMREVEHYIDDNHTHMEMWGENPLDGKEMKMIEIDFTRTSGPDMNAEKPTSDMKGKPAATVPANK